MGAGDVVVYGPTTPDKLDALMTGGGTVVADDISMASYANGMVVVLVIKAA